MVLKVFTFDTKIDGIIYQQQLQPFSMVCRSKKDSSVRHESCDGHPESKMGSSALPGNVQKGFKLWVFSWKFQIGVFGGAILNNS